MRTTPLHTPLRGAVITAVAVLAVAVGLGEAAANPRAGLTSPLRVGSQPGCRWVQGQPRTIKVCDTKKVCRMQTIPAQRIWACGTVRD
ncbi:MAG: hypothetical protein OEL76_04655 [Siculibacillus sp.]|nr:hypothetical protein [Siculibacillus sp.]